MLWQLNGTHFDTDNYKKVLVRILSPIAFCLNINRTYTENILPVGIVESETNSNMKAFNILRHYKRINITNGHFIVHFIKHTHKIKAVNIFRPSCILSLLKGRINFSSHWVCKLRCEKNRALIFSRNPHPTQIIKIHKNSSKWFIN